MGGSHSRERLGSDSSYLLKVKEEPSPLLCYAAHDMQLFDIFEVMPSGESIWRAAVNGQEKAIQKLCELASTRPNAFRLMHIPTRTTVATFDGRKTKVM